MASSQPLYCAHPSKQQCSTINQYFAPGIQRTFCYPYRYSSFPKRVPGYENGPRKCKALLVLLKLVTVDLYKILQQYHYAILAAPRNSLLNKQANHATTSESHLKPDLATRDSRAWRNTTARSVIPTAHQSAITLLTPFTSHITQHTVQTHANGPV